MAMLTWPALCWTDVARRRKEKAGALRRDKKGARLGWGCARGKAVANAVRLDDLRGGAGRVEHPAGFGGCLRGIRRSDDRELVAQTAITETVPRLDLDPVGGGGGQQRDSTSGGVGDLGARGGGVGDEVGFLRGVQDVEDLAAGGVVVDGGQPVELDTVGGERVGLDQFDPRRGLAGGRVDAVNLGGDRGGIARRARRQSTSGQLASGPTQHVPQDQDAVGKSIDLAVAVHVEGLVETGEIPLDGRGVAHGARADGTGNQGSATEAEQVAQDQGAVGLGRDRTVAIYVQHSGLGADRRAEQQCQ